MARGNDVFRKVMKGIQETTSKDTAKDKDRKVDQAKHLNHVKTKGDQERERLRREERQAEEYKQREAERRRRKTD